jgi:hypothetical protein
MSLPQPADLTSLVLRTDFNDEEAWETLQAEVNASAEYPCVTYISDPAYAGVSIQALIDEDSPDDPHHVGYLFLADDVTMRDQGQPPSGSRSVRRARAAPSVYLCAGTAISQPT